MTNQSQVDNWIRAAQAGDQIACEALYRHFVGAVYRLTFGVLLQEQDAEEVVQDSFSYAFRQIDQYDPSLSAFKTHVGQAELAAPMVEFVGQLIAGGRP